MSKATEMFQNIWLQAFRDGEVRLKLNSSKEADRVRFQLYNAVKLVKKSLNPSPLKEAAENCQITYDGETVLVVSSVVKNDLLNRIAKQTGQDLSTIQPHMQGELTPDQQIERDAQASLVRVMEKLAQDSAPETEKPKRVTPYYSRD